MTRRTNIDFRGSVVDVQTDQSVVATFQGSIHAVVAPHSGTVSWLASIQVAPAVQGSGAGMAASTIPAPREQTLPATREDVPQALPGICAILTIGSSEYVHVPSCAPYTAVRNAVTMRRFELVDGMSFPVALLESPRGHVELRPQGAEPPRRLSHPEQEACVARMASQASSMSDYDADVLDALYAIWLRRARAATDLASATVDDVLELRGLLRKKSGSGRRGGYEAEQRLAVQTSIERLASVWVEIPEAGARDPRATQHRAKVRVSQSRLLVITHRIVERADSDGSELPCQIDYQPGGVVAQYLFGAGRQVALMSVLALRYDPYRQRLEKRLIRYLSSQWRIRASKPSLLQPFRMETLLRAIGETFNPRRPARTKARVERVLNALEDDGAIREWRYEPPWDHEPATSTGLDRWPLATVVIEPPDAARERYLGLRQGEGPGPRPAPLGEQLRSERSRRGLSPSQAAEQVGVPVADLEKLERGDPGQKLPRRDRQRVVRWLRAPVTR